MSNSNRIISRREMIKSVGASLVCSGMAGCTSIPLPKDNPAKAVDANILWARRQEWNGIEEVRGVVHLDNEHYLMVRKREPMGWQFAGGVVDHERYGPKHPEAIDLVTAVTNDVHNQAMVAVTAKYTKMFAYGYGINKIQDKLSMIFWFYVIVPTSGFTQPHANLRDVSDAKWVNLDDPMLGDCLQQRIQEYKKVGEGGTVIIEPCRVNS